MGSTKIFGVIRDVIVGYGGWCAGDQLASKLSNNEKTVWQGQFWGMVAAGMLSRFVDKKLEEKAVSDSKPPEGDKPLASPETQINYRTDHAERVKSESKALLSAAKI